MMCTKNTKRDHQRRRRV